MRKDNFVHFFSLDHEVQSQVTKDLLDNHKFSLEQLRPHNPNVGETMVFPDTKPLTFHRFVKSRAVEPVNYLHLKSSMTSLKHLMDTLDVKTVNISKIDNNIEPISWDSIEYLLREELNSSEYTITVCTGEVIIPLPPRRSLIIKEFHESAIGGHQGVRKLFNRIRDDF